MADIDRVLEAEQVIQDISSKLRRMKNAAELLDNAQTKVEAVIKASNEIITRTGEFVKEGTEIVKRIGDYDIQSDMSHLLEIGNSMLKSTQNIEKQISEFKNFTSSAFESVQQNLSKVEEKSRLIDEKLDNINKSVNAKIEDSSASILLEGNLRKKLLIAIIAIQIIIASFAIPLLFKLSKYIKYLPNE